MIGIVGIFFNYCSSNVYHLIKVKFVKERNTLAKNLQNTNIRFTKTATLACFF